MKREEKEIAIIGVGVSVRGADSPDEFFDMLMEGEDAIGSMPQNRIDDIDEYYQSIGKEIPNSFYKAAYLEHIDEFDYEFFGIPPKEAALMDPNQRLFLQTAWSAIDDAGMIPEIKGSRTGVYVGCSGECEYRNIVKAMEPDLANIAIPGNCTSMIPGRLAFLLDLKGPNLTVNTVCSSSLVAVHLACHAIRNGECDMAIAGGTQIYINPIKQTKTGVESLDGKTRTFDANSSGTGTGEGILAVLLKPLSNAKKDKDHIYAVIKGSASNHDGYSIGIAAPNPLAQEDVIVRAWEDAGINPMEVSYIEAHGTGTRLGDPVEIEGLTRAFARYTKKNQFCGIGCIKTNFGHLDYASGIAGMVKTALMLEHKKMVPSLHFRKPNPNIDFQNSPVYVNTELKEWKEIGTSRKCGVSAFGYSGTNCHIVMKEATGTDTIHIKTNKWRIATVSAKSKTSLYSTAARYLKYIQEKKVKSFDDFCFTLTTTKIHYPNRIAIVTNSIEDLEDKLAEVLRLESPVETSDIFSSSFQVKDTGINDQRLRKREVESILEKYQKGENEKILLRQLANYYVKGAEVDFTLLYISEDRNRVYVPPYYFERNRCWVKCSKERPKKNINVDESVSRIFDDVKINGIQKKDVSDVDIQIAKLIGYVTGCDEVNFDEPYYQIGGDSIMAIELTNKISEVFGIHVSADEILKSNTIKEFSNIVMHKSKQLQMNKILPVGDRTQYPVSTAQKRMYLAQQMERNSIDYNIASGLLIKGTLDVKRLEKSIQELINRHDVLRTKFLFVNHQLVGQIIPEWKFVIDYDQNLVDTRSEDRLIKEFIKPFRLDSLPLFRMKLIKRKEDEHILLTDFHHIVTDGKSINIMTEELITLYEGKELPKNKIQYKDYAVWQSKEENVMALKEQETYWLTQFKDSSPVSCIPKETIKIDNTQQNGETLFYTTDKNLVYQLRKRCEETNSTMFVMLLSAYYALLFQKTKQKEIVVGTAVLGRTKKEIENIPGVFVNTIALLGKVDGKERFSDFMGQVKKTVLDGLKNQDYPYELLTEKLREAGYEKPLFETMFMLQNQIKMEYESDSLQIERIEAAEYAAKYEITLNVYESEKQHHLSLNYRRDHFRKKSMEKFLSDYIQILNQVTQNKDVVLEALKMKEPEPPDDFELPEINFLF